MSFNAQKIIGISRDLLESGKTVAFYMSKFTHPGISVRVPAMVYACKKPDSGKIEEVVVRTGTSTRYLTEYDPSSYYAKRVTYLVNHPDLGGIRMVRSSDGYHWPIV